MKMLKGFATIRRFFPAPSQGGSDQSGVPQHLYYCCDSFITYNYNNAVLVGGN